MATSTKTFIDSWTFDETLQVLSHSASSSTIYKLLVAIRKEVEWPQHKENINKLHKLGCLKQIVAVLRSSHLHVVSVALSILGNCCMDSQSTNKIVINYNGLWELMQVLKRYPKEDGVNGRVFRIIGNMSQHMMADLILDRERQLFIYIVQCLQKYADDVDSSTFSEATIVMGVRALRLLLNDRTFNEMVKNSGLLKALGSLLITCSTRWNLEKKDHYILDNIIKFLLPYSRYKYYPGIIEMRNTGKGDSLIHLSHLLPLAPKKIVKIIMNFIRISQQKSDLPIPEICGGFIRLLKENPVAKGFKQEYRDYIRCLCYLLEHPANRSSDRCMETIPQLIKVLNDFQNFTESILESSILIVNALDKCCYHEPLIREQLECNIVGVLIKKIEWIIGSSKTLICKHKMQMQKKRKFSDEFILPRKKLGIACPDLWDLRTPILNDDDLEFSFSNTSPKISSCCCSTSSGSESDMVTSPWSSPGASPSSQTQQDRVTMLPYPDLSDSEDYSPVCSDVEDDAPSVNLSKDEDQTNMEIERLSDVEDDNSEGSSKLSAYSLKYRLLNEILTLLKTYAVIQPTPLELCSEPLLLILLKCSNYFEHSNITTDFTTGLISRILQCHDFLIPLMQTKVIPAAHSLLSTPHGSSCTKCTHIEDIGYMILGKFTCLAESGRGKGDIANRLMLGSSDLKKHLALVIPYIIRNKPILNKLMLNCGGLDILMKLLLDEQYQQRSVRVVCVLAVNTLGICSPQQWSGYHGEKMAINDYRVADNCENVVTFVLDDNSCLSADRDFLCEKSCFFNSLLNGGFKESSETFVKLHHTDYKALKSLIHLLHCDFDKTEPKDVQLDTSTILEVIMLCDRYLLEDLCAFLTECVQQFGITAGSVPLIYKWSIESKTNILRIESIAYALVGEVEDSDRCLMFSNLFSLGYSEEIVCDIQELITRYLSLKGSY